MQTKKTIVLQNILTIASEQIKNSNRLEDLYTNTEDGELIKLDYCRNGKDETVSVVTNYIERKIR